MKFINSGLLLLFSLPLTLFHLNVAASGPPSAPAASAADSAASAPRAAPAALVAQAPTWPLWRAYQVWRDELPDTLPADQVEIVLLSPDQRCRPASTGKLFGLTLRPGVDPATYRFCLALESFAQAPGEALPVPLRLATQALPGRQPAAIVAALAPAPQRRYVALVAWDWREDRSDIFWHFEEAVIDRETGRWVWHAARTQGVFMHSREAIAETLPRALQTLLRHELPRDLLRRGWWREAVPVPDSRWVPAAEVATRRPAEGRAGVVFVNEYMLKLGDPFMAGTTMWPASAAELPQTPGGDQTTRSTRRWTQGIPLMATRTQALLDLPVGDYLLRVGTEPQPLRAEAGRITVLRLQRQFVTSNAVWEVETEERWRERILPRFRHAFLAEHPQRGAETLVSWFQP